MARIEIDLQKKQFKNVQTQLVSDCNWKTECQEIITH